MSAPADVALSLRDDAGVEGRKRVKSVVNLKRKVARPVLPEAHHLSVRRLTPADKPCASGKRMRRSVEKPIQIRVRFESGEVVFIHPVLSTSTTAELRDYLFERWGVRHELYTFVSRGRTVLEPNTCGAAGIVHNNQLLTMVRACLS